MIGYPFSDGAAPRARQESEILRAAEQRCRCGAWFSSRRALATHRQQFHAAGAGAVVEEPE